MKSNKFAFCVFLVFVAHTALSANSNSGGGQLIPQQGMSALDRAKINSVQAQNWSKMGKYASTANDNVENYATTYGTNGIGSRTIGSNTCVTNIGTSTTTKGVSSGRYGPGRKSNNIVVVKGDVISLCK